jgi:two-component system, cell cycle response regulator
MLVVNSLETRRVVIRIAALILLAELFVSGFLFLAGPILAGYGFILNPLFLVLISTPGIYIWVIKPFVDERANAMAQASRLAHTDVLTQLANRRLIVKQVEKFIADSIRHMDLSAVILLDLDGFKPINDRYGHEAGDAVLIEVAKRLTQFFRSEDTVGRFGGDEFVVLLNRLGPNEKIAHSKVYQIAKKLIETIGKPIQYEKHVFHVGVSVGIRLLGADLIDTEGAIRDADIAMFHAKKAGGNQANIYEKEKTKELF